MPQMNKGGKFVFGKSNIQESGKVQFPIQAMVEYQITAEGKVYLFTGSKVTGGFCVTRKRVAPAIQAGPYSGRFARAAGLYRRRRCISSL